MKLLRTTQIMFSLNAAVMLTVGVLTLIRPPQATPGLTVFIAVLLFSDAALLLGCARLITKRQKWLNLGAVAVLAANILLTVTDDFGLPDLIMLVFWLVNLVVLILTIRASRPSP